MWGFKINVLSIPESPVGCLHDWQHTDEQHEQIKRQDRCLCEAQEEVLSRSLETILTQQQVRYKLSKRKKKKTDTHTHHMHTQTQQTHTNNKQNTLY